MTVLGALVLHKHTLFKYMSFKHVFLVSKNTKKKNAIEAELIYTLHKKKSNNELPLHYTYRQFYRIDIISIDLKTSPINYVLLSDHVSHFQAFEVNPHAKKWYTTKMFENL